MTDADVTNGVIDCLRAVLAAGVGAGDGPALTGDVTLGELGFDSLDVIDLAARLRRTFGVDVEPEWLTAERTPGQIAARLSEGRDHG
jgi:act minimal PKS acyl carrier protein